MPDTDLAATATPKRSRARTEKGAATTRAPRSRARRAEAKPPAAAEPDAGLAAAGPTAGPPHQSGGTEAAGIATVDPAAGAVSAGRTEVETTPPAADADAPDAPPAQQQPDAPAGAAVPDPEVGAGVTKPERGAAPAANAGSGGWQPITRAFAIEAARKRFAGDPLREPLTEAQFDQLMTAVHDPGQSRSNRSTTFDYLRRGMSSEHARIHLEQLRRELRAAA